MSFLVLEGGEGSGKTTALSALSAALADAGYDVLVTREPGGTAEGQSLRALLLAADGPDWDPGAELLLMTAARIQHVNRVIKPALAAGRLVLCDRFVGSTLAYQGAGRGLAIASIRDLHARFVGNVWPDLTIFLDVDPRIGLSRSRHRLGQTAADEGRFESLDLEFHQRVRDAFLSMAKTNAESSIVIDASRSLAETQADMIAHVTAWLRQAKNATKS